MHRSQRLFRQGADLPVTSPFLSLADLFPPERFGGSERVIMELSRALVRNGYRAGILAGGMAPREPDPGDMVPVWRYRVRPSPLPLLWMTSLRRIRSMASLPLVAEGGTLLLHHPLSAWGALKSHHARQAVPIGFFYGPIDEEWAWHWRGIRRLGARGLISPVLLNVMPLLLRSIQNMVLQSVRAIVVLGFYTQRLVTERVPHHCPPVFVVPPGVDLARFQPPVSKADAKRAIGMDPATDILLSVRRLVPRMGLSLLLEALWILRRARPSVRLVLVGTGELAPKLMREAASLGIADSLSLAGYVGEEELTRYYQAADVFVLPSVALEGFGLVTLEALASGVPVVGTDVGETPEVLGNSRELGRLVPPGDARAVADACAELLEARNVHEEACRAFATRFTWAAMAETVASNASEVSV